MKSSVVFSGINSLDFHDVRAGVLRIPEVAARVFEAQKIWDELGQTTFNLFNFLVSDNQTYMQNIRLKGLAAAVVQIGLYDRYIKKFNRPDVLVGSATGDSALKVCAGKMTFKEMIQESEAIHVKRPETPINIAEPFLSGVSLDEYEAYEFKELESGEEFDALELKSKSIETILRELVEDNSVRNIVNVGPGHQMKNKMVAELEMFDVRISDSIDMDLMLTWFWRQLQEGLDDRYAVAQ